jgi:asparagine synthase (glutamine-hydrolysing)
MCGIAGIISFNATPDQNILQRMSDAITHRGPDDSGIKCFPNVALAHRRLSIIDLGNGHQPLCNEDGTVWIVFNGEIYNHLELRKKLEERNHQFKTNCDTEVIVHLYEEYGTECISHLDGMFALAIYDSSAKRILLSRDRLGQKPLFYFSTENNIVFASELSALKQHPSMPRILNKQALHDYFSLQYIPAPHTVYHNVFKLPPGHRMVINTSDGTRQLEQYWKLDFSKKTELNFHDAEKRLRELLTGALKKRLMSDVPYGTFLSGGLDSTIITALMGQLCDHPVKTFTIGFNEQLYDERNYAMQASHAISKIANYPLDYHVKTVNPDDFDLLKKLVRHYGEPYSDASMLPTYMLSEFTREQITVVLSGDGADEMFAGYERYMVMKYAAWLDRIPFGMRKTACKILSSILPAKTEERSRSGRIQRLLSVLADNPDDRYFNIINRFPENLKQRLYGDAFKATDFYATGQVIKSIRDCTTSPHQIEKLLETDIHSYLPGDILTKVDIASMACSLELRSPFMDHELVEFAASLPFNYKQRGQSRKHILKSTFSDLIPDELRNRSKKGFGVPIAAWFRGPWQERLRTHLLEGQAVKSGFFNRQSTEKLINSHCKGKADFSYPLWSMLIFELFLEEEDNF